MRRGTFAFALFILLFCVGSSPFILLFYFNTEPEKSSCIGGAQVVTPNTVLDEANFDFSQLPFSKTRAKYHYELANSTNAPLVSVITAFYNPKVFTAPECILGQSLQQIEWIIVDDASTSGLELLDPLRNNPRVIILTVKKSYLPGARNAGIKIARAPYLFFLDTDDYIEATYLEKAYWVLETNRQWGLCNAWSVGFAHKEYIWKHGFQDGAKNLEENQLTSAMMARKDVVDGVGGFNESLVHGMEDWDLWIRVLNSGYWGYTITDIMFWYRVSPAGKWSSIDSPEKMAQFKTEMRTKNPHAYTKKTPDSRLDAPPYFQPIAGPPPPAANILKKQCYSILLIISRAAIGGSDQFNYNLLESLVKKGWAVTVVVLLGGDDNKMLPHYRRLTPDVFVLQDFISITEHPRFLAYLINSRSPTVTLITNAEAAYLYLAYLKVHAPNTLYMDYSHSEEDWKSGGYPRFSIQNKDLLDRSLFASQKLADWTLERGHDKEKVSVVHVGVDTNTFKRNLTDYVTVREMVGIKNSTLVISYVARIVSGKLPTVFSGTMKKLAEAGVDFYAFVIGDGPLREQLERDLDAFGITSRVSVLGSMHNEQVRRYLSASDVIMLPSIKEGISLSLMEGMSMGLVPLSMDIGGQRELIIPEAGFLIQLSTNETEMITNFEQNLKKLDKDRALLAKMSAESVNQVKKEFSLQVMTQNMILEVQRAAKNRAKAVQSAPYLLEHTRIAAEFIRMQEEQLKLWDDYTKLLLQREKEKQLEWNVLEAEWEGGLRLHAITLSASAKVKEHLSLAFLWSSSGAEALKSYRLFVHFRKDDVTAFQGDRYPLVNGAEYHTSMWKHGILIEDRGSGYVPEWVETNKVYDMVIGWFDETTGERLKLTSIGNTAVLYQSELKTGMMISIVD